MSVRHAYRLNLSTYRRPATEPVLPDLEIRTPAKADIAALAELMLDAYRGTIDYDGETIGQTRGEVESFLRGDYGTPLLDFSRLAYVEGTMVSACLVSWWGEGPLISFVMTRAAWKGQGLGTAVLHEVLHGLAEGGHTDVRAVITEGNRPSEIIFGRAGFVRVTERWSGEGRIRSSQVFRTNT